MLLLFWNSAQAGLIGVEAAILALTAPPATLVADEAGVGVTLDATACVLTLTAPPATLEQVLQATAGTLTFSAPPATVGPAAGAVVTLQATANLLTLSSGPASVSIDLTATNILINGIVRSGNIRPASLTVTDNLDEQPNLCTFVCHGFTPHVGEEIVIAVGTLTSREFAGHLTSVDQVYEGQRPANVAYHCEAVDYTRLLDRRLVHQRFPSQPLATTIAQIMSSSTSGFTTTNVATDLPTIAEIEFVWEPVTRALSRLAQLVGAYWYVDYFRDLHFFITETIDPPDAIVTGSAHVQTIARANDLSQVRTQVLVAGQQTQTTIDVVAGAGGNLPIEDATPFSVSGGQARSNSFQFTYATKFDGGALTTLQGAPAPTAAPSAAIAAGVGGVLGATAYRVSFKSAGGETVPGPASNTVTGLAFPRPDTGALTATPAPGVGRLVGTYRYAVTFVTARGETDPGASVATVVLALWPVPGLVGLSGGTFGPLVGAYGYKATYVTAAGETTAGAASTYTALVTPGAAFAAEVGSTIGPLIGTYQYRISIASALGETLPGTATGITLSAQPAPSAPAATATGEGPFIGAYSYKVSFVSALGENLGGATGTLTATVVTAAAPTVSGDGTGAEIAYAVAYVHPLYGLSARSPRTVDTNKGTNPVVTVNGLPADCGWNVYSTGTVTAGTGATAPLYKVAEMGVGVASFTHTNQTGPADGGVLSSLGRTLAVTGIPVGPPGTTARRLYRTKAGGSTYYLAGQLNDNTSTSLTDTTPDAALVQPAPTAANPTGKVVRLTLPTGPTGTTMRRIYRTKAGGSTYFYVGQVDDNTAGQTFTDATADAGLVLPAPLAATGGETITVSVAAGPAGTIARRLYRTLAGGSTYRRLVEIADNTTTSFVDRQADASLGGEAEPLQHTGGGQNVTLSNIPPGPTGTTMRRVYRTKTGGSGDYAFVGDVSGSTTMIVDSKLDTELGEVAPTVNTAGASLVQVSSIPIGPPGTTARRLYRSSAGVDQLVAEIPDNATTTYLDSDDADALGAVALTESTVGAQIGASTLLLASTAGFYSGVPYSGWARAGRMPIHYAGLSGNTLTGIPSTGVGAIVAALKAGAEITAEPLLINVTASPYDLLTGSPVQILVLRENTAAQAALAAVEGGDGVHQILIEDTLLTLASATTRADAELVQFATPEQRVTFASRDRKLRSGKSVVVNLGPPTSISGTFKIQQVVITEWGIPNLLPLRTVIASSVLYSFEHLLRRVELGA